MDKLKEFKNQLHSLLGENQHHKVLLELEKQMEGSSNNYRVLILLKARFKEIDGEKARGILNREEWEKGKNNLTNDLFSLVASLEETDITPILDFKEELQAYQKKINDYEGRLVRGEKLIESYKEEHSQIILQLNKLLETFQSHEKKLNKELTSYRETFQVIEEFFKQAKQQEGIPSARIVELQEQLEQQKKHITSLHQELEQSKESIRINESKIEDQQKKLLKLENEEIQSQAIIEKLDQQLKSLNQKQIHKPIIISSRNVGSAFTEMILVEGGTFDMDTNYQVSLSDFEIAKYPLIQSEWESIMGSNPSHFKGAILPVENISWNDCQEFIQKLNQKTGLYYRLPTEAEWHFAAMGGNQSLGFEFSGSNEVNEVGWYKENSQKSTHVVGKKEPNELGIYDMSGNVLEWCKDWFGSFPKKSLKDPKGPDSGSSRVLRGGSWYDPAINCRVADRLNGNPFDRYRNIGFRLARTP